MEIESPTLTPTTEYQPTSVCHVVAVPYPGRGHINPMLCLCDLLLSKNPKIFITFVVTEEWLDLISSDARGSTGRSNFRFTTLPNVIPSEHQRAKDFPGFLDAVCTKLEAPFERLLDGLEEPPLVIVADTFVKWALAVGNHKNIPVASLWTQSMSMYSMLYHFKLLQMNGHFPIDPSERGDEVVDYIPGVAPTRIADLPTFFTGDGSKVLSQAIECISIASKAQFFLSTSFSELEPLALEALRPGISAPIYSIGPAIPFLRLIINDSSSSSGSRRGDNNINTPADQHATDDINYLEWLDSQPSRSVLYVSLGSFLSVSDTQLEEIVAGVLDSGCRFLWVARGDTITSTSFIRDNMAATTMGYCYYYSESGGQIGQRRGVIVPWCDQLRVLCHDSVGGFWTHCGWNSTLEAIFSGVPMLTCPIFWDQIHNAKQIVEDWKIGFRVKKNFGGSTEELVTRQEITQLVRKLMMEEEEEEDSEKRGSGSSTNSSTSTDMMRIRSKGLQQCCLKAIARDGCGGSSDRNLDAFIGDILLHKTKRELHILEDACTGRG
ncbi:hypothetical protein SAY86_013827 [Trapa natans]|uniref:Uncharacterized protein n=1 Tax=Trapa natans TaxID=22666 RepID=A0AAN7QM69_TRANT|nr:hypothetical protein SAY86_013827 [Trapa natans]